MIPCECARHLERFPRSIHPRASAQRYKTLSRLADGLPKAIVGRMIKVSERTHSFPMKAIVMMSSWMLRSVVGIVGVAVMGSGLDCALAGPVYQTASGQGFFAHGLAFSPYLDGQAPPGPVSLEQIRQRLGIINGYTQWIRTYSATSGLENIPEAWNDLVDPKVRNHSVAMGTWIRSDTRDTEIANLIGAASNGWVDLAVVGNEELFAGALSANALVGQLTNVRHRLDNIGRADIPVTTAEPFDTLFAPDGSGGWRARYPEVIEAIDVVLVNIYPFWDGTDIDSAVDDLAQHYQWAVDVVGPDKPVIISETGWPSEGRVNGAAEPSLDNATRYFFDSLAWATANDVPMFYFEAFDEKWKEEPPVGPTPFRVESHWGVWYSDGTVKIPEPSSLTLLGFATLALLRQRRISPVLDRLSEPTLLDRAGGGADTCKEV